MYARVPDGEAHNRPHPRGAHPQGLEACGLICALDCTASNEWNGQRTFQGRSLHDMSGVEENPYQRVIRVIGRTLSAFSTDGEGVYAYGFGDSVTRDHSVFPLHMHSEGFKSWDQLLQAYKRTIPKLTLSGPTNFGPAIREAIRHVKVSRSYKVLVIITDGETTAHEDTMAAVKEAAGVPLSIIIIGVGDDVNAGFQFLHQLDDDGSWRAGAWDNVQFVPYNEVMARAERPDIEFAVSCLQELPSQYRIIKQRGLLNVR